MLNGSDDEGVLTPMRPRSSATADDLDFDIDAESPTTTMSATDGRQVVRCNRPTRAAATRFHLSDSLSIPGALLVGAAWGVVLGLIVGLIRKNDVLAAWFEDVLVVLGATAVA